MGCCVGLLDGHTPSCVCCGCVESVLLTGSVCVDVYGGVLLGPGRGCRVFSVVGVGGGLWSWIWDLSGCCVWVHKEVVGVLLRVWRLAAIVFRLFVVVLLLC